MQIEQKKSAVDLTELAIGIVIIGVVVTIGASVLTTYSNSQLTDLPTYQVVNETLTTVTETGETLATTWVKSVDSMVNASSGQTIASGNYTWTVDSTFGVGTVTGQATSGYNNTNWKATYTVYNLSDPSYSVANKASIGLGEYGNWFKILAIVGIAAVILSIIFMAFGRKDGQDTVNY